MTTTQTKHRAYPLNVTDVLEDDFGNSKAFMKKKNHIVHTINSK